MNENYIVYTEILTENGADRWYYGRYTRERANEVAEMLGNYYPTFHCVCAESDAKALHINNLPC